MLENKMSRSPSWQQSLLLVALGAAVGYPSFVNIDIWGGTTSRYQNLFTLGFFAGTVAFLAGFASFLTIAFKAVKSSPLESSIADSSGTSTKATSNITPVRQRPHAISARGVANNRGMVLGVFLRVALAATVGLTCFSLLRDWGQPPLTSSYGRSYWLNAFLSLLLSQLPFA
jgi:hypothetical protein